jgi:hypothetical protein
MPTNPTDLYRGKTNKPEIISQNHGRIRGQLVQSMTLSPQHSAEVYEEFDNPNPVFSIHDFAGTDATMDWLSSDQHQIESAMMDVNPSASPFQYDPAQIRPIDILIHRSGVNAGKVTKATLLCSGQRSGETDTQDIKAAEKEAATLKFLKEKVISGGDILYSRFVKAPVAFVTGDDVSFDVNGAGSFAQTAVAVDQAGGASQIYVLHAKWNGTAINDTSQYAATPSLFTPTVAPVAGDVWEVYTVYQP